MFKGAIFDLDGTLLDSMFLWEHAGEWFLASVGQKARPNLAKELAALSLEEGADYMKDAYHLPMAREEIVSGVKQVIRDFYYDQVKCKTGVPEFLEELRNHQIPMAIATATDGDLAKAALKRNGILSYFSHVITCDDVGAGKNRPDIFHTAREKLGTQVQDTWIFEDALHAIQTAAKAGYPVCGIYDSSNETDLETIQQLSTLYIKEFKNAEELMKKMEAF